MTTSPTGTGAAGSDATRPHPTGTSSTGREHPLSRVRAHAEAVVDLGAITANTRLLRETAGTGDFMAVVKADGYGHGAAPVARAALAGGATMLGVATLGEAVALRAAGIDAPVLSWLWAPGEDVGRAVAAGAQIGIASIGHLQAVIAAAGHAPGTASGTASGPASGTGWGAAGAVPIHLKVDTGMGRNGVMPADLDRLLAAIADAEQAGTVEMVGIMSHLASADEPDDQSVAQQTACFARAVSAAHAAGLRPRWRHLANTAATITAPATRFDMVRCGIGIYGLCPVADDPGLRPAMTLRTTVALAKAAPAGQGVGYGLTYHTDAPATLALVPVGYGDGIPRNAGNVGQALVGGVRRRIAGRVAMDQVVFDCGDDNIAADDDVLIFGPGDHGEPTAAEWAEYCGTINYEIVTRVGPRVPRRYVTAGT